MRLELFGLLFFFELLGPAAGFSPFVQSALPSLRTQLLQTGVTCARTTTVKCMGVKPPRGTMSHSTNVIMAQVEEDTRPVRQGSAPRLLGSRRLAAATSVIKTGVDEDSDSV